MTPHFASLEDALAALVGDAETVDVEYARIVDGGTGAEVHRGVLRVTAYLGFVFYDHPASGTLHRLVAQSSLFYLRLEDVLLAIENPEAGLRSPVLELKGRRATEALFLLGCSRAPTE